MFYPVWIMITPEPDDFASKKKRLTRVFRLVVKEEKMKKIEREKVWKGVIDEKSILTIGLKDG